MGKKSQHLASGCLEARPSGSSSYKCANIYRPVRPQHKFHGPRDLEVSPRWQLQKSGLQNLHNLFTGRYWWAGTRQSESTKMVSTAYVPWEQLHSPLDVCWTWSLPLRLKLQGKQRALHSTERLEVCLSLLSVQYPRRGSLTIAICPIITVQWDLGMQAPLATRTGWSRLRIIGF